MIDYSDLGKRIQKARKEAKLTQIELAERVNLSFQHISNIERGETKVSLEKFVEIASVLDISTDQLLLGSGGMKRDIYIAEIAEVLSTFDKEQLKDLPKLLMDIAYMKGFEKKPQE